MTYKINMTIDKLLTGVIINKNNEINYSVNIVVELEKDIPFEYAIVNEGDQDDKFIPFISAKKFAIIKHKNINNKLTKKLLLLKSSEPTNSNITIDIEKIFNTDPTETMESDYVPRGKFLLNPSYVENAEDKNVVWYKDPWILGAILVGVLLVFAYFAKSKKSGNSSIFLD